MCGRFTLYFGLDQLCERFQVHLEDGFTDTYIPRYNISPTQEIAIVTNNNDKKRIEMAKWGLIPAWSKDTVKATSYKTFNARAETITQKPVYRGPFKNKRCLIPSSGFFEWKKENKQPYFFHIKFEKVFAFAGLYDDWHDISNDICIRSCTIITTTPNELVSQYHDRMPVILKKKDEDLWLSEVKEANDLLPLLKPFESNEMAGYKVSKDCNNGGFDSSECIKNMDLQKLY